MCLMSQSWDNVANSYALAFNSKLTCSEIIWCTYTDESSKNLVSTIAQVTPLDAGQQQLVELTTAMVMFLLCSNVESTTRLSTGMIKNRPRLSFLLRLGGLLSKPLKTHDASHHSYKNAFLCPPLYAHITLQLGPIVGLLNL